MVATISVDILDKMLAKITTIFMKLCLAGLVIHALLFNELTQYRQKAFGIRIIAYPLIACASFFLYWLVLKRKKFAYPIAIDICLTTVVLADFAGNTLNLYDSISWWDDIMHFLISIPWVIVAGLVYRHFVINRHVLFGLILGYGAVTHVLWEVFEYISFVRSNSNEFTGAYKDTIGDLVMSLCGSLIGAVTVAYLLKRSRPTAISKRK